MAGSLASGAGAEGAGGLFAREQLVAFPEQVATGPVTFVVYSDRAVARFRCQVSLP